MPSIQQTAFGQVPEQGTAHLYTLTNDQGNKVKISTYGATLTSVIVDGAELVVGFDDLAGYLGDHPYYGALIGRYGNRIANARFELDGVAHELIANEGKHQLHGGPKGFDKYVWEASSFQSKDDVTLLVSHVSADGDMGFPGEVTIRCAYTWNNLNELTIDYSASSTEDTVLNLTNHAYFNIGDEATVEGLILRIKADQYTPINKEGIPTGELASVVGTPFDFRKAKPVGQDIDGDHPHIQATNGYDHNFVLSQSDGTLREVAWLEDPATGRSLTCLTTEPGLQLFTANFEEGQFTQRGGEALPPRGGICLETQHFPNSPNQANFKTPLLRADGLYETTTVYRFA